MNEWTHANIEVNNSCSEGFTGTKTKTGKQKQKYESKFWNILFSHEYINSSVESAKIPETQKLEKRQQQWEMLRKSSFNTGETLPFFALSAKHQKIFLYTFFVICIFLSKYLSDCCARLFYFFMIAYWISKLCAK